MNVLILSNPARGYYKFFNAIASLLQSDGHKVTMAVDCEYSAYVNRLDELDIPYHVFSTYFAKHDHDSVILEEYSEDNLNSALLSDFERAETIDLWGRRENFFFDKLKSALLSFFARIIREHQIDYVIFENASDCFSHFALFVCQKHKAKYCGITSSRLPGRFTLTEKPWEEHIAIDRNLKKIELGSLDLTDEAKQWCTDYLDNIGKTKPDYMTFNGLDKLGFLVGRQTDDKARVIWGAFRFMFGEHDFAFKIGNPLIKRWKMFRRVLERRLRARALATYYSKPDLTEDFLLYPLHYHPKPLIRVGGKPILELILEGFISSGFHRFFISTHYKPEMIREHFGDGSKWNVTIEYVHEEKPLGTGGALGLLPRKALDLPLVMMNGDLLTRLDFAKLVDFHEAHPAMATVCVCEYTHRVPYGVVQSNEGRLSSIEEKPLQSFFVNAGIYVLSPELVSSVAVATALDMPSLIQSCSEQNEPINVFPIHEYWMDIGRIDDLERAQGELELSE